MKTELKPRISRMREALIERGFTNRSSEWFVKNELPNVGAIHKDKPVIVRRAIAIDEMLKAMCDPFQFENTRCFEIEEGSLLAGIIPMGSNGLGKVFPNYLTEDEIRVGSSTNKSQMAILGHNSIDYTMVLEKGLKHIIDFAKEKLAENKRDVTEVYNRRDFYEAVCISCQAVIDFSNRFAALADDQAEQCEDQNRADELRNLAKICRKVPLHPATNFYEAIQSMWMVHCCLHASMDYMSLGRIDQVLNHYYDFEDDKEFASELMENFIIKAAGRLNLTTDHLVEQDHMDYNAALGVHSYYIDQRAGLNNFLQNVIIGGKTPDGKDACNPCTYMILEAFKNVNLSTPGLYVRLHNDSPKELVNKVSESIEVTKNLPYILNDEVMIPALRDALSYGVHDKKKLDEYQKLANDYCVDGCWEPILNGKSDWTFGMVNGMTILECTLNRGACLSPNPELLRGQKLSIDTGVITTYDEFIAALKAQMQFFVDQSAISMCLYYMTSEFIVPTPLVSALFEHCLETGIDKSWGGCEYTIGGTIIGGIPDMTNTIAAIKKWVFDKKRYQLQEVVSAMQNNFISNNADVSTQRLYDQIKVDFFTNSPQFGNNRKTIEFSSTILDIFHNAVNSSRDLASKVFLDPAGDDDERIIAMRAIAGYYGPSMERILKHFDLTFTAGIGTFEQYNWQGAGIAASAARNAGDPLAPNFTPTSGTWHHNPGRLLHTFDKLNLKRFAGGVITDMCLDPMMPVENVINQFIHKNGGMLTITVASPEYKEIYEKAKAGGTHEDLKAYADLMVRVGGWNAPFITLPLSHMENYVNRPLKVK